MEEFEHMDQHLKRSLDGLSFQPKITSFDAVLKKLEKRKRRRFFFWWLIPGILVTGGVLAYLGLTTSDEPLHTDFVPKAAALQHAETKVHSRTTNASETTLKTDGNKFTAQKQNITASPQATVVKNSRKNAVQLTNQNGQTKHSSPINLSSSVSSSTADFLPELENAGTKDNGTSSEYLQSVSLLLPLEEKELEPGQISENGAAPGNQDSLAREKRNKRIQIVWGLHLDPQAGSNLFSSNANLDYNKALADNYSEQRWKNNSLKFNYHLGIKVGMILRNKWELLAGFGFQKFTNSEKVTALNPIPTFVNNYNQGLAAANNSGKKENIVPAIYGKTYTNSFNYLSYKLEASKYVSWRKFTKMKVGFGLQLNQLLWANTIVVDQNNYYSYYSHTRGGPLKKWTSVLDLKLGFIHDLNSRTQFQFCPAIFCAPNSMFAKNYVVKQRPFGLSLECMLLFKLAK